MLIVKCPRCKKRYDPGVDEELESLEDMPVDASLKVVCPACGQWLRLPEKEPIRAPAVPPKILREMMSQSRLIDDDEDSSDRKSTRTSRSGGRRRDRDEDSVDEPPRRKKKKKKKAPASNTARNVVVGVLAMLFFVGICISAWKLLSGSGNPVPVVARNPGGAGQQAGGNPSEAQVYQAKLAGAQNKLLEADQKWKFGIAGIQSYRPQLQQAQQAFDAMRAEVNSCKVPASESAKKLHAAVQEYLQAYEVQLQLGNQLLAARENRKPVPIGVMDALGKAEPDYRAKIMQFDIAYRSFTMEYKLGP